MPRYFFHLRDGATLLPDDGEGQEFASLKAARREAIESARQILSEAALSGLAGSLNHQVEVHGPKRSNDSHCPGRSSNWNRNSNVMMSTGGQSPLCKQPAPPRRGAAAISRFSNSIHAPSHLVTVFHSIGRCPLRSCQVRYMQLMSNGRSTGNEGKSLKIGEKP
jgi:hypothetical protein